MNWDHARGEWREARGKVRQRWEKLTDDDLDVIAGRRQQLVGLLQKRYGQASLDVVAGRRDQLVGLLQKRYGQDRDEIERQVREFEGQPAATVQ